MLHTMGGGGGGGDSHTKLTGVMVGNFGKKFLKVTKMLFCRRGLKFFFYP